MNKFGSGKLRFIAWTIPVLFAALAIATCSSCKTTKYIDRETVKIDSSVIQQYEGLQRTYEETVKHYEAERESWLKTGILFDTIWRNDTVIVNKVTFDNGRIKTIEGRIIAVNQSLHEKSAELLDAHNTIDSLSYENERKEIELSKKQTAVTKYIKRSVPWWAYLLCVIAGMVIQWKLTPLNRIEKFIKYYL